MCLVRLLAGQIALLGLALSAAVVQQNVSGLQAPSAASVDAAKSLRLITGQDFPFQLRFNRAPKGYEGGEIKYVFERVGPTTPSGRQLGGTRSTGGRTELHDGQAIYTFSLTVTQDMVPGTWKLTQVMVGRAVFTSIPILDDVFFQIPEPTPVVLQIQFPKSVTAGQRITFTVTLDKFPPDLKPGCMLMLSARLRHVTSDAKPSSNTFQIPVDAVEVTANRSSYQLSGSFAPDLPGGEWQGEVSISSYARDIHQRRIPYLCRVPPVEGSQTFAFRLEPAANLVTPTLVEVTINPSQVELMLGEGGSTQGGSAQLERSPEFQ